jgi:MoaA/NifB/PqqE/SkfB family radical SAM enzyme
MFDKATFCSIPWSTIQINPDGSYKVCAFSGSGSGGDHGYAFGDNGKPMNVLTHSILDALNSNYHKQIRLAQSKNIRHELCRVCWDRDDANKNNEESNSYRVKRTFKQTHILRNMVSIDKAPEVMAKDGYVDEYPVSLDLRFTNTCNMKCIMCSSLYSSLWEEDEEQLYGSKRTRISTVPWHDSPIWWQRFNEIKDRVKHIYVTGGEPFIIKGHEDLLDNLIASGHASDVTMEYDTNLTVINNKLLKKLKQFKNIVLSVSCDDIEDKYELIRFPGNFNKLLDNLNTLKQNNIKVRHLSACIGIYSLFTPIRVYDYFNKLGYDTYSFRFLRNPGHVDIAYLPDHIKDKVINIYQQSNLPVYWVNYMVDYFEKYRGKFSDDECMKHLEEFKKYMNKLDEIRGTDWKNTFPEVVDLLSDTIIF